MIDYKMNTGPWKLSDIDAVPKNGLKVFSCFHGGGGSSLGYKLAGFDVLGGVEIDPRMMQTYRTNHKPVNSYLMGVGEFNEIPDAQLPPELFSLDILDGSPPCSSFSWAGSREKKWGVKKKFREGQSAQVLDDLFFDFIRVAEKLKPKVVVAENVKGLIQGNAKGYVKKIHHQFVKAGYECQLFLLNAAFMGVPQRRERTFFIARRKDLGLPRIVLSFTERPIPICEAMDGVVDTVKPILTGETQELWEKTRKGRSFGDAHPRGSRFGENRLDDKRPSFTLTSGTATYHWDSPRKINDHEIIRIQTFPEDYIFPPKQVQYVCGMSVPPFMTQRIANQIYCQLLLAD